MLILAQVVLKQADRALKKVTDEGGSTQKKKKWVDEVGHFRSILLQVYDQKQHRVMDKKVFLHQKKIVSVFEEYTGIIVKGFRIRKEVS
jgi:hypothetical protein